MVLVKNIVKGKGMAWSWGNLRTEYRWCDLVSQLRDEDIMKVCSTVNGGAPCTIVSASFASRPGSYDHKRHHAEIKLGCPKTPSQLRVWDFVLERQDGSKIRIHPQWSSRTTEVFEGDGHSPAAQPPRAGLGGSDGRGTFARYKAQATSFCVFYDPQKG